MRAHLKSAWISFSVIFVCAATPVLVKDRDYPLWIQVTVTAAIYAFGTALALMIAIFRHRRGRAKGR